MNYNEDELNAMHKDPNNWKWGFIYFNPRDKRVLVLKRQPAFGMTLNFANPNTGLLLLGILIIVILINVLSRSTN